MAISPEKGPELMKIKRMEWKKIDKDLLDDKMLMEVLNDIEHKTKDNKKDDDENSLNHEILMPQADDLLNVWFDIWTVFIIKIYKLLENIDILLEIIITLMSINKLL